jgi:hypothetical protein
MYELLHLQIYLDIQQYFKIVHNYYIRPESCSIAAALQAMLDNNGNAG